MSKDRKIRNFDFLKEAVSPLPTREEVIQKAAELTGQPTVGEEPPAVVVAPEPIVATPAVAEPEPVVIAPVAVVEAPVAEPTPEPTKGKAGRKPLEDTRKPFTTTITVGNKKQLRQLCAEHDLAMSDVINEILAAYFESRQPVF